MFLTLISFGVGLARQECIINGTNDQYISGRLSENISMITERLFSGSLSLSMGVH